jgi:hypothetical protein
MALASLAATLAGFQPAASYVELIQQWRDRHQADLKADDGWLTVVGLEWLHDGANRAGSAPGSAVRLPADAPASLGVFTLSAGRVTFEPAPGHPVQINGQPAPGASRLRPDTERPSDRLTIGTLSLTLIERGDRFGIRVRDRQSPARLAFTDERWYPTRETWRISARFEPYQPPKMLPIVNVLGQVESQASPGAVVFTLDGRDYRLDPIGQGRRLFFNFKDRTSGDTTYPAGRFLYADLPQNGRVALDFNKAENPPCAFTEFATCPLPPKQNQLPVRVEAGELYGGHGQL